MGRKKKEVMGNFHFAFVLVIMALSFFFFGVVVGEKIENQPVVITQMTDGNPSNLNVMTTEDYSSLKDIKDATINILWLGNSAGNVHCSLLDKNFNLLYSYDTTNGKCEVSRSMVNESTSYYLKIDYNASFVSGGIESAHKWFIINLDCVPLNSEVCTDNTSIGELNIDLHMQPAIWADIPTVKIQ